MLRQCATTAITVVRAASIMFAMAAMLGRLMAQLKMPRLDAYAHGVFQHVVGVREGLFLGDVVAHHFQQLFVQHHDQA